MIFATQWSLSGWVLLFGRGELRHHRVKMEKIVMKFVEACKYFSLGALNGSRNF